MVPVTTPRVTSAEARDRAGTEFWDEWWRRSSLPEPIDPRRGGLKNYPYRSFHRFFERALGESARGETLIEIGCAQSVFLPYFANYFAFRVLGLDRSEIGCERARRILEREKVAGDIYCGDLFEPPAELVGACDVAVAFGVLEHFDDTAGTVRAVARFLKPRGRVISWVPNLTGALGRYQRLLDPALYKVHRPLDRESFAQAHVDAGLEVELAEYLMPVGLEVFNVESWKSGHARKALTRAHGLASRLAWFVDEHWFLLPPNRWTSPYVACVAQKPAVS
jgi:SAM-dependent methyltransferase